MDRIEKDITYSEFCEKYLRKNKPCIIKTTLINNWHCTQTWIKDKKLDIEYFKKSYGHMEAPVVNCEKQFYSSHEKSEMNVEQFLEYWENRDNRILYLKDWHLQRLTNKAFYDVPFYFSSDWLNEYFDHLNTDDYRFVYIGVKGSWTPFHADVFRSYSWSANICGLKKWIFYPPGKEELLRDQYGKLPFNVDENYDHGQIVVFQKAGEIIFVPSGWFHQVFNLEDTVSINHNWVNAFSMKNMLAHLKSELSLVKHEIEDCKTMEGFPQQCQLILNASSGIDYIRFFEMICYLTEKRIHIAKLYFKSLADNDTLAKFFITSCPGSCTTYPEILKLEKINQLFDDLKTLYFVLNELLEDYDFTVIANCCSIEKGEKLQNDLEKLISYEL